MKCFIASAFNRDDVDSIYDGVIKPLLIELSIKPLRVDRVEHNEDIDDKIFNLLDESDFCIADLTYARPSVYYEAGYAFGSGKPVIYITRSDHFKAKENDVFGNFRVHFDLQMKNIIPWTEANKSLEDRLRKRINHVIKPIIFKKNKEEIQRQNEEAFLKMSLMNQLASIKNIVDGTYDALGYSEGGYPLKRPKDAKFFRLHMEKFFQKIYRQHHVLIYPSVLKSALKNIFTVWFPMITKEDYERLERIETTVIYISIKSTRVTMLKNIFPSWKLLDNRTFFKKQETIVRDNLPSMGTIIFIDNIKSLENFTERFQQTIEKANRININPVES